MILRTFECSQCSYSEEKLVSNNYLLSDPYKCPSCGITAMFYVVTAPGMIKVSGAHVKTRSVTREGKV